MNNCNTYVVEVPKGTDSTMFKEMVKRMGWILKPTKASSPTVLEEEEYVPNECTVQAIRDCEEGRVTHASSVEDLFNQILG